MKVLLVNPPSLFLINEKVFPSLGLLYLSAHLKANGYKDISLLDLNGNHSIPREVNADVVGFYSNTPQFPGVLELHRKIESINKNKSATYVIGGPHVSGRPDDAFDIFDYIVMGEGEEAFLDIVTYINHGIPPLKKIIRYPYIKDLDSIKFPDRELCDIESYKYFIDGRLTTTLLTSRGCPYRCAFCLPKNTKILMANMKWVYLQDIKIGEEIINVEKKNRWKYTKSLVTAVHKRKAMVYAIETENGTVQSTKEHPWLMKKSWKSIEDIEKNKKYNARFNSSRAVLRKLSDPTPVYTETQDYKWGYISGAIVGDGCLRLKHHKRPYGEYHYMNLSLVGDYEMLDRVLEYAQSLKLPLKGRKYNGGKLYKCDRMVACDRHRVCQKIKKVIYDRKETDEYIRGFLSGIFDAEGSGSNNSIRIHNLDKKVIKRVRNYLIRYKFKTSYDYKNNRIAGLRLLGGLSECTRFLTIIIPVVRHKREGMLGKSICNKTKIKRIYPVGKRVVYNLTTKGGNFIADGFITHNCANNAWGKTIRLRSPGNIIKEIKAIIKKYGYRSFMFFDDTLTVNKKRMELLCKMLKKLDIIYRCFIRGDTVTKDMLQKMKNSGCVEVGIGVESGSQQILDTVNKGETVEQNKQAIEWCKEIGIRVKAFLIIGLPGENKETIQETKDFLKDARPDDLDATIFTPYPGSIIYEQKDNYDIWFDGKYEDYWYKGKPGKYKSVVSTSAFTREEIVKIRDNIEKEFKGK